MSFAADIDFYAGDLHRFTSYVTPTQVRLLAGDFSILIQVARDVCSLPGHRLVVQHRYSGAQALTRFYPVKVPVSEVVAEAFKYVLSLNNARLTAHQRTAIQRFILEQKMGIAA